MEKEKAGASVSCLDHGYVGLVEHWGSDERIIEAARMSTDGAFRGWGPSACPECEGAGVTSWEERRDPFPDKVEHCPKCDGRGELHGDERLLRYLWKNKHATPFEMAGIVLEVKAPIFVFREWMRHRTQSYNELSARYVPIPDEHYTPTLERLTPKSSTNRQSSSLAIPLPGDLNEHDVEAYRGLLQEFYMRAEALYELGLSTGIPKELARLVVPVARYSKMRASANLRNWLAFLTLRMDSHAQWEIQEYARAVGYIVEMLFPRTWELFMEGR